MVFTCSEHNMTECDIWVNHLNLQGRVIHVSSNDRVYNARVLLSRLEKLGALDSKGNIVSDSIVQLKDGYGDYP